MMLEYVVNFGKHSGKKMSEIPDNYLRWLLNPVINKDGEKEVIDIKSSTQLAAERELIRRDYHKYRLKGAGTGRIDYYVKVIDEYNMEKDIYHFEDRENSIAGAVQLLMQESLWDKGVVITEVLGSGHSKVIFQMEGFGGDVPYLKSYLKRSDEKEIEEIRDTVDRSDYFYSEFY